MPYPSDLKDSEWLILKEIIPNRVERGFKRKYSERELLNAIFYINKTGCQYRYLPSDYPPWQSVHRYFTKLTNEGVFEKINNFLRERVREKAGRNKTPSLVCIDSQSVKEDVSLEDKETDGNKKVKGRKRHVVVDVLGLLLFCTITVANISDIHLGKGFLSGLASLPRLEKVLAHRGYQGMGGDYDNFNVEVSSKKPEQVGFIPIHKR
jgi:putative transposase